MNLHQKRTHPTYVEGCFGCKAGTLKLAYTGINGADATRQKRWDQNLAEYRAAVAQGIQPETTRPNDVREAVQWSNAKGVAYNDQNALKVETTEVLEKYAA